MKGLTEFGKELLDNLFCDLKCALYYRHFKDKYFMLGSTSPEFPPFVMNSNWQGYTPVNIDNNFVLLFAQGVTLSDDINKRIQFARKCVENHLYRYYLKKLGDKLPEIEIPYVSFSSLGSVLKNFLPDSNIFLWLRKKFSNFYKIIYSYPQMEQKYVAFSETLSTGIVRANTVLSYELIDFLENNNVNYLKIITVSDNLFLWGFYDFPPIEEDIDKLVERFYPDNFLFLDSFEIFMKEIFFKKYDSFRNFAKDLQRIFSDIEGGFPVYFKVSTDFLKDEFYLDEKGVFLVKAKNIENLNHLEDVHGKISYYLPFKNAPQHLISIINSKLKEILMTIFHENCEKQVKFLFDFVKNSKFDKIEIDSFLRKMDEFATLPELKTSIENLMDVLNRSVYLKKEYEEKLRNYSKLFGVQESVWEILLRETELSRTLILLFKFIKEAYEDVSEIVWFKREQGVIKDFVSSTRFIREQEFIKAIEDESIPLRWRSYFVIKDRFIYESDEYTLCFLFEQEVDSNEYTGMVKAFNLFLYFLVNFKKYHTQLQKIRDFQKDFPVKIRVMKNMFSLPEKSEYVLFCEKNNLELNGIIRKVLDEHSVSIKKKDIRIEFLKEDKIFVRGYEPLLNYAFLNLMKELIDYNRIKGRINIAIDKRKGQIYIEDTGIGLSKTQIDMLKCKDKDKNTTFSLIGEIFRVHNFELSINVEKGIGNKIRISV